MANIAYLRQARVRVSWGGVNLSSYTGGEIPTNSPVVYNVQIDMASENEGPTASMRWDPTGPGMAVYEKLIASKINQPIVIEFFYADGKLVPFTFYWSGQSINYGNDMSITVNMQSQLAGLVNANIRNTAQAYDEKTGTTPVAVIDKTKQQFGLDSYSNLVQYSKLTLEYWQKVKLLTQYGNDWTFGNAVNSVAKQTGDQAFATNIKETSVVMMSPFSYGKNGWDDVIPATTTSPSPPTVTKRYGYFLGPSIINSIRREANWKPPQQPNENLPGTQKYARDPKTGRFISQKPPTVQQTNTTATAKATSAPLGTANARANPAVQNKDNPEAPDRQNALTDEKGSELSFETLLTPILVGLKPHDILYIPSLDGDYIEDWIVQQVNYSQNDGRVDISIKATRTFGLGTPMNPPMGQKFLSLAHSLGLVGGGASLEAWDRYAWGKS